MRYVWLGLAFLVEIVAFLVARLLRVSQEMSATIALASAFLALFPFVKQFAPKLKVSLWVIADGIAAVVAWLLLRVVR